VRLIEELRASCKSNEQLQGKQTSRAREIAQQLDISLSSPSTGLIWFKWVETCLKNLVWL
jgi:hypothetical protein